MVRAKTTLLPALVAALAWALTAYGCGERIPLWADPTLPSTPTGLSATAAGASAINLSWNASTDNLGVTGYIVRRNGADVGTSVPTGYADTGLSAGTTYTYIVVAVDAAGNKSPDSASASATTSGTGTGDTTRPSSPTGLTATAAGVSAIDLSWNASTDNVGVTGYVVRRNGTPVATPVATGYADTGLSQGTTYRYTVAAVDAAGNSSSLSTSASATTAGTPPPALIPSTLGWFEIPNTQLANVCAANLPAFSEVAGATGCSAITDAWSGGAFDEARNRLLIWGGGHTDYAGNEVYALELDTLTLKRLNDPSTPVRDAGAGDGTYADGKPGSRHTYNHLAYIPSLDAMFAWGGSLYRNGSSDGKGWLLNLLNLTWTATSTANGPGGGTFNNAAAHDPNTGLVYMHDWTDLRSYNPSTNAWSRRSSASAGGNAIAAVIDPVRKKYFFNVLGSTTLRWYDISSATGTVPPQSSATTGCAGFLGDESVGIEYDPIQDRIVGWNGGNTVYILNPDTVPPSCTTVTTSGGPAKAQHGTFGRFRYAPSLNVFAVCNGVNANCYTLRLTP